MGGSTANRTNGKGHGDSDTWVISDNGGRVQHAALREAMTKAIPASIGSVTVSGLFRLFVAQSVLVLIWQRGCTLWSDHQ